MKTLACCFMLLAVILIASQLAMADQITEPFLLLVRHGTGLRWSFKYGDGKTCTTGVKRYCCAMPPQWLAQLAQSSFYVLNGGPIEPILPSGYTN
uniref:Uncharacterized protein n=1 Tax=Daphnia galeata TaxID=27404 RepID=A0A8J2S2Q6_9CRUS|nr:unnamed protein product [Daphnia galeata]